MKALGLMAGVFTTACWLPQLIRSWRTRSTRDLSWWYLVVLAFGVALWLFYGVLREDTPLVLANIATLSFVVSLMVLKAVADTTRPARGQRE